jgi:hypothetical protein
MTSVGHFLFLPVWSTGNPLKGDAMRIFISNSAANLSGAIAGFTSATVEAEFGEAVVEGSVLTLAHHGPRADRPCPCSVGNLPDLGVGVIGVSHFDLDTLGGVMAIMGRKPQSHLFWDAAAFVDTKGAHKLPSDTPTGVSEALQAFWAWSEKNRLYPDRSGSVTDVTDFFEGAMDIVSAILGGDESLLAAGRSWASEKDQLDQDSLVDTFAGVQLRSSESFVNHLYHDTTKGIVGFNTETGAITVSVPDPVPGFSCGEFLQGIFGPEAGGRDVIGGSPRGVEYNLETAKNVAVLLAAELA